MWWKIIIVFIGGGIGATLRYGATLLATRCGGEGIAGTLAVNTLGCLALGALYGGMQGRTVACLGEDARLFIAVGFLGALTTFSTFNWEIISLLRVGRYGWGAAYFALSMALGLLCSSLGYYLTHSK